MFDLAYTRHLMVERQIAARGLRNPDLLRAMRVVPREAFVEPEAVKRAYEDAPLKIEEGQTISQPYIVGLMIERAGIKSGSVVLEVGTGSGYAAAVMSRIAGNVYTVERYGTLAKLAMRRFDRLGYKNIMVRVGDGTKGWPQVAPFDAIIVAASGPSPPQALKEQLAVGAHLIIPIGPEDDQRLFRITRSSVSVFEEIDLGGVRFVPLIGEQGWKETDGLRIRLHSSSRTDRTWG
jgi:protein-L-isoaspartate(D-aspartate) O-methyltransferase